LSPVSNVNVVILRRFAGLAVSIISVFLSDVS
jgi:hypothetical protein